MVSRYGRLFAMTIGVWSLAAASAQAALCASDSWGGRAAAISASGTLEVTITAQTNLHHFGGQLAHAFCQGDFYAKAVLVSGFGPSCESLAQSTHHNTLGEGSLAFVQKVCYGLSYDRSYHGGGIHWGFGESEHFTESSGSVYFPSPPPPCNCDTDPQCCVSQCGGTWDPSLMECNRGSPILLNLNNNGANFHLTSAEDGVWFDLKAQGTLRRVAWTEAGSTVAFLVLDRNGNGRIDDGSELFGNATPALGGGCLPNGFVALAELDENRDGKIDRDDPAYAALRLWTDLNHDGLSQPGELATLSAERVNAIFTTYAENRRRDRHGNWYRFEGTAIVQKGNGHEVARRIYDVFLVMLLQ